MRRTKTLIGMLCLLLGATGIAWKCGYFEIMDQETRPPVAAAPIIERGTWEPELLRQLDDAQAQVSESLSRLAPHRPAELRFPVGDAVHLQETVSRACLGFMAGEIEAYRQRTSDSAETQAAAAKFLEACFARSVGVEKAPSVALTRVLGKAALDAGCSDRTVQMMVADYHDDDWDAVIQPATVAALDSKQTLQGRLYAHEAQLRLYRSRPAPSGHDPLKEVLEDLVEWEKTCGDDLLQQALIYRRSQSLLKGEYERHFELVYDNLARVEEAPQWLRHMLSGAYRLKLAWHHRGGGLAFTVSEENMERFSQELEQAARHLSFAWHLHPELPHSAELMISVTMGGASGNYGTPTTWFQRTIDARFDSYDGYERYYAALQPRWGGSMEELVEFSQACILTGRFDTSVPRKGLETLTRIQKLELGQSERVTDRADVLRVLDLYLEGHAKAVEVAKADGTEANILPMASAPAAALCVQARRMADARRLLDGLDEPILDLKWELARLWEPPALTAAAVFAVIDDEPLVTKVLSRIQGGFDASMPRAELEELLKQLETRRDTTKDERARPFFLQAIAAVKRGLIYQTGEWLPLTFEDNGSGWTFTGPEWRIVDDKTLWMSNLSTGGKGPLHADLLNQVPLPFVIEFELTPKAASGMAGVTIGSRDYYSLDSTAKNSRVLGINESQRAVLAASYRDGSLDWGAQNQETPPYRFRVKCWPKRYIVQINGLVYFDKEDPNFTPAPVIGLGSREDSVNIRQGTELTLTNIRIRRLSTNPPPMEHVDLSAAELFELKAKYYRKELEADPEDGWAMLEVGQSLLNTGRPVEALPFLKDALQRIPRLEDRNVNAMLGKCYRAKQLYAEALELYRRDLSREIDHPASLLVECSRLLSSCPDAKFRDGNEALALAQRACDKPKSDWTALLAKAAAQAELSDFDGALVSLDAAEKSAKTAGEAARKVIAEHRAVFKDKRPFRFVAGGE